MFAQVQDETGWIAFFPGPFANITCGIDHTRVAPVIGCMWHTWHSDDEHFRWVMYRGGGMSEGRARVLAGGLNRLHIARHVGKVAERSQGLGLGGTG